MSIKIKIGTDENFIHITPLSIITIGRSSKANHKINDPKLSSLHFQFQFKNNKLEIKDLNSKNGLYLNEIKIDQADMYLGDQLRVGSTYFSICEDTLDDNEKAVLTFPALGESSIDKKLKVDFTGARKKNQKNGDESSKIMEINIRKKSKSQFKLSKQEIAKRYPLKNATSQTIDLIFQIILIAIPLIVVPIFLKDKSSHLKEMKLTIIISCEILIAFTGYYINKIKSPFSIGEKISGIKAKTIRQ